MIKNINLLLAVLLLASCGSPEKSNLTIQNKTLPVLDIRVFSHYTTVINGEGISSYQLGNFLKDVTINSDTKTRIFFNENATIGMMQTLRNFVRDRDIKNSSINVFTEHEMDQYFAKHVYIDRLSEDEILFNGDLIHPENLPIALNSNFDSDSTTIHYSIIDSNSIGQHFSDLRTFELSNYTIE